MNQNDRNLVEKAWADMRARLDRDMPVKQTRRKRPIFVWWLVAPLVLAGLAAWGGFVLNQPRTQPPPVQATKPQAGIQATRHNSKPAPTTYELPANQTANHPVRQKYAPGPELFAAWLPQTRSGSVSDKTAFPENNTAQDPPQTQNPSEGIAVIPGAPSINALPLGTAFAVSAKEIDQRDLTGLSVPATTRPLTPQPFRRTLAFGLTCGVSTEQFHAFNGAHVGAVVDWNFAPQMGLRSGLAYVYYQPSIEARPTSQVSLNSFAVASGNYNLINNVIVSSIDEAVFIPLHRFHRIEAPLMAYWEPINRLRLYSGFRMSYLISAKVNEAYAPIAEDVVGPTSDSKAEELNDFITKNVDRWDVNFKSGIGYALTRRLEMSASVQGPFRFPGRKIFLKDAKDADPYQITSNSAPNQTNWLFTFSGILFF